MRRFTLLLVVLSLALSGCSAKMAASAAARGEIKAGDELMAAKKYGEAAERYLTAAGKTADGELRDEALGKAGDAVTRGMEGEPLPEQVEGLQAFAKRVPSGLLPLSAHNWLSVRLSAEAENAYAAGAAAQAETHKMVVAYNPPPKPKPPANKTAPKKPAGKPAPKPATTASATVAATVTPASAPATPAAPPATAETASAEPTPTPTADELRAVAEELPALGQPEEMRKLYEALADLIAARDASARLRAGIKPGSAPNLSQKRSLGAADVKLQKALGAVKALLTPAG